MALPLLALPVVSNGAPKRKQVRSVRSIVVDAVADGSLLDALLAAGELDRKTAQRVFRSYTACCLYANGFDFPINEPGKMEAMGSNEELEIQEVSLRDIYVADLMLEATSLQDYKNIEAAMTTAAEPFLDYDAVNPARLLRSAAVVRADLEQAFDYFGTALPQQTVVFSGYDAEDDDDDALFDGPQFAFDVPFLSTSTDYEIARRFSQSQMGFSVGGEVWRLTLAAGAQVLPLTSAAAFGDKLVSPRWVEQQSVLEEEEILLSAQRTPTQTLSHSLVRKQCGYAGLMCGVDVQVQG